MGKTPHLGKNIRSIRTLRGMKQRTLARELGIAQQNVSKLEKMANISREKLEAAAKVLGITVEAIEKFNEKTVLNNNIAMGEHAGQIVHPVKDVIDYFKDELSKKDREITKRDNEIKKLKADIERYRKNASDSSHPENDKKSHNKQSDTQKAKMTAIG